MSQQAEYDAAEYQARLTALANRLVLKRPDSACSAAIPGGSFPS